MQSLAEALREMQSRNQKAREDAARRLLREAGEQGVVASVLAHRPDRGFLPGVLAALSVDDAYARDAAAYLGAWHGSLTQSPALIAFHAHDGGTDRLHVVRSPLQPEPLAKALTGAGVSQFSLRPTATGTHAYVYDRGGLLDLSPLARSVSGDSNFTSGTGQRLGQGAGADSDANSPAAAYRDQIRRAEASAQRVPVARLARLPAGAIRAADLRTWHHVIAQMPDDRVRRGVFADWLEERGHHHDDLTLHLLRHHEGPLFVTRHPRTKKAVAVPGSPVRTLDDLITLRQRNGLHTNVHPEVLFVEAVHGPRGIAAVHRVGGHHGVTLYNGVTGFTRDVGDADDDGYELLSQPDRPLNAAQRLATRLAFGD